jgi:hypothetical protein
MPRRNKPEERTEDTESKREGMDITDGKKYE